MREGETGFLAELESPADLARALGSLFALSADERRAFGDAARERVLAEFTVDAMVERTLAVFSELA